MQISIAKTHEIIVNTERFSDHVRQYIFDYGLKQVLNDAGSAGKNADEKLAMANKKLDALYAGEVRQARESDPVRAEARKMARAVIDRELKKVKKEWDDFDPAHMAKLLNERAAKFMDAAKVIVDQRKLTMGEDDAADILAVFAGE